MMKRLEEDFSQKGRVRYGCTTCAFFSPGTGGDDVCESGAVQFMLLLDGHTYLRGRGGCKFHSKAQTQLGVTDLEALRGKTRPEWIAFSKSQHDDFDAYLKEKKAREEMESMKGARPGAKIYRMGLEDYVPTAKAAEQGRLF